MQWGSALLRESLEFLYLSALLRGPGPELSRIIIETCIRRGGDLEIRYGRTVPQCPVQFRYVKSRSDLESLTYARNYKSTNPRRSPVKLNQELNAD